MAMPSITYTTRGFAGFVIACKKKQPQQLNPQLCHVFDASASREQKEGDAVACLESLPVSSLLRELFASAVGIVAVPLRNSMKWPSM